LVTGDKLLLDNSPKHHSVITPKDCAERFL
jgi:hypothetical protein